MADASKDELGGCLSCLHHIFLASINLLPDKRQQVDSNVLQDEFKLLHGMRGSKSTGRVI